jgi:hypothetical protein
MKKIFSLSILALSFAVVSCSEEEDDAPTGPNYQTLNVYSTRLLGGGNNPSLGSFYSTREDSVYFTSRATEKQSFIDLIYYFGSQSGDSAVIAAPSDIVFNNPNDQNPHVAVKTWTTKNDTRFRVLDISSTEFAAMLNDSLLQAELDSGTTLTKATKLSIGDIVGFKTIQGKLGAFEVKGIENGTAITRSITLDVKVQP